MIALQAKQEGILPCVCAAFLLVLVLREEGEQWKSRTNNGTILRC